MRSLQVIIHLRDGLVGVQGGEASTSPRVMYGMMSLSLAHTAWKKYVLYFFRILCTAGRSNNCGHDKCNNDIKETNQYVICSAISEDNIM